MRIYRTDKPPAIGAQRTVLISGLERVFGATTDEVEITMEPRWEGGMAALAGIPWPPGWTRVYFTTVVFDRQTAVVGSTTTLTRSGAITDATLHQRVTWQQLTFNWPLGADQVRVYSTPPGVSLGEQLNDSLFVVTYDAHRQLGAIRFVGEHRLPQEGCDLHLVPVTFSAEGTVTGRPTVIRYKGLLRLPYRITEPPPNESALRHGRHASSTTRSTIRRLEVRSDWQPSDMQLDLALVLNRDRLPLSVRDGKSVHIQSIPVPGRAWTSVFEFDGRSYVNGYLRLFATPDPSVTLDVAVMDPSVRELRQ